MPKKKSGFEKMRDASSSAAFEIPESDGRPKSQGRIIGRPSYDTNSAYDVIGVTTLMVIQESSCGTIFLDQEQGVALAENLQRIFCLKGKK